MLKPIIGGLEHTVPVHANVIIFAEPWASKHVRRIMGQGYKAVDGGFLIFISAM